LIYNRPDERSTRNPRHAILGSYATPTPLNSGSRLLCLPARGGAIVRLRGLAPTRERRTRAVEYAIVALTIVAIIAAAVWLVGNDITSP
jgi:hypothetical protein